MASVQQTDTTRPETTTSANEAPAVPPGYKQTEMGVIPQDWMVRSLRSCLRSAPDYGINAAAVSFDDGLPTYLRITDISEDNRFRPSPRVSVRHPYMHAFFLRKGDVVFARTGASVGKSYLYTTEDGPLVFAGFLIRATPDPEMLDPVFLSYCVQSKRYWDWVATMSIRSGQPGINGQEYGTFQVSLPKPSEQRVIAEALSDVDKLLGSLEKLIAKKRAIKRATMQQLLTGKTRLPGFEQSYGYKSSELGLIPNDWQVQSLREGIVLFSGHHVLAQYCNTKGEGVPYLTGPADFPNSTIKQTKFTVRPTSLCRPNDILVTVKGSGAGTLVEADSVYCISRQLMAIRVRDWNAPFIFYSLLQNASKLKAASTGLIPGLSRSDILDQELPLPADIEEQRTIATALSDMDAEIVALERRRDKTRAVKQGMMQQLLTGRVRLVRPEPDGKS